MSDVESGWRAYPDAVDDHVDLCPVDPGRVVGLGAICDIRPERLDDPDAQSFSVSEFAALDDARRVILHDARGFTIGRTSGSTRDDAVPDHVARDSILHATLNAVLPDDDESPEAHPWAELADLARARGLKVSEEDLRGLPYDVILTDDVLRWLAKP
ncbi:hypothetical protein [Micromonospora sp. SH-82]|uniref:hypothetical protein n=1 Tax=Micromonospora sp. SH-82 TaxID=3132938 RepID=UPI003EB75F23